MVAKEADESPPPTAEYASKNRLINVNDEETTSVSTLPAVIPAPRANGDYNSLSPPSTHLDDVLSSIKIGRFHWKMLALVSGGYFAVCAEIMLFIFLSSPLKEEFHLGDMDFPWLPFCTGIASIIGGFVTGFFSDRFGRQIPFLVCFIFLAVFGIASAFATSFPLFIALRCLVTIGIGVFEAVGFVMLLEFLPRQRRGSLMVVVTMCGALGAVLVAGLAWAFLPSWGWRWFVGACAVPSFLILLYQPCVWHETPRFLFASGRKEDALKLLKMMADTNGCEFSHVDIVCPIYRRSRGKMWCLFSKELRYQTAIFSALWFLQATGYWGVTVYLPEYMFKLGSGTYFSIFSIFVGEIPGLFVAMVIIEKHMLGRIRTLRFFSAVTASCLLIFAFFPLHVWKALLIIFVYFSMVPIYSILNTYTPEVFPTDIRSTALAWMNIVIEGPGLITPFVGAKLMSSDIPWLYPVVWGSVFVVQCILTLCLSVETAGEDLEDNRTEKEKSIAYVPSLEK